MYRAGVFLSKINMLSTYKAREKIEKGGKGYNDVGEGGFVMAGLV